MKKLFVKSVLISFFALLTAIAFVPFINSNHQVFAQTDSSQKLYYNNGHRDTIATKLSAEAKDYYANFTYDYSKIANNSYLSSTNLKTELSTYMRSTLKKQVKYSDLPKYWKYTDSQDGKDGVTFFYTDEVSTNTNDLNREHVWPKSAASFYQQKGGSDLHHLRPAHSTVNSARSNYEMAEFDETSNAEVVMYNNKVAGYIKDNKFEPLPNVKGDVARIFLYVYLCWGQPNLFQDVSKDSLPTFDSDDNKNDGTKRIESLETLLQWCQDDPVDTWEMEQNDIIESIQGNRNVFIDYPEYAWLIFGLQIPENLTTPNSASSTSASATQVS